MTHAHGLMTGHELVKCGLVLSLLGGVRKHGGSNERIPVRGDIHLLIVGDPGLGKSQMLKAACAVAPRGIYVCGNSTSSSGLTGGHPWRWRSTRESARSTFSCAPVVE
jgi:DNA replicative helicase MCM subunit Mcm2 (Cdc46/Mcm family)